jgi:high-affinity K+ transport system ATPase subunit B
MPASPPNAETKRSTPRDDGTQQLLQWGGSMVGAGLLCILLLVTVLGGYSRNGASRNAGWFALIVALMCLPFGGLLLTLGVAKWMRNRREQASPAGSKEAREQERR